MFTHIVKNHYVAIDATRRIVTDPRVFAAAALVILGSISELYVRMV